MSNGAPRGTLEPPVEPGKQRINQPGLVLGVFKPTQNAKPVCSYLQADEQIYTDVSTIACYFFTQLSYAGSTR